MKIKIKKKTKTESKWRKKENKKINRPVYDDSRFQLDSDVVKVSNRSKL